MQCARHPKVETNLACGRCGKGICPACSISGPVGMRCRECSSLRSTSLYKIRPERFAFAALVGTAAGTIVGVLIDYSSGTGFFLWAMIFVGPIIGRYLGTLIVWAAGQKRGLPLEILAGVSVIGGAILAQLLFGDWRYLFANAEQLIVYGVAVVLTAVFAIGQIRNS